MSLINVSNLTFSYEGSYDNIFENTSFQIDTDWKLGLIGRNGRGKTTFLNLLRNRFEYTGSISASVSFDYFPYKPRDTNVFVHRVVAEVCPECEDWEVKRELTLLQLRDNILDRKYSTLSNGEKTKVLLAALFLKENSFLLIDEPTNHLDMHGRELVSRYLNGKRGFILVSHDRVFLDGCVDHILSINKCGMEVQRGNFSSWLENKERQDSFELAENEKLKKNIKRLEKSAREKSVWSDKTESSKIGGHSYDRGFIGHKAAKMMKRSKVIESRLQTAIDDKSKLLKNIEEADELKISQIPYHTNRLVSLSDISIFYGDKVVCQNISFTIEKGDRIALCGKNGSGKTSIIKLICGEDTAYIGELQIGSRLEISYVSQDTSFLSGNLSDCAAECRIDESLFKAILRKLDFSRVQFEKDMRDFSEGQKKKVLIAKSLCETSHILIWDEPLNYIDLISRIQLERLIMEYKPTILFVEHDAAFCNMAATKTIAL